MKQRFLPEKPLPRYIFIPGVNPHPKKEGGHMEGIRDPVTPPLHEDRPEESVFLRYALDLFNHGYFWESHVYFEALWNAHGRKGDVADFFKALIKLGAAGVKVNIDQMTNAQEHYRSALELIKQIKEDRGENFLGFNLETIEADIRLLMVEKIFSLTLTPDWT